MHNFTLLPILDFDHLKIKVFKNLISNSFGKANVSLNTAWGCLNETWISFKVINKNIAEQAPAIS
jgi:hypothetical protein